MKKYVAIVVLTSSPICYETKTIVIPVSGSKLIRLHEDFSGDLWTRHESSIGKINSFSVFCFSYGEFSKEKTSEFNQMIEKEVKYWNEKIGKAQIKLAEVE